MREANILEQTADIREKLFTMALWKLAGTNVTVTLSLEDMEKFQAEFLTGNGDEPVMINRARADGIEFTVMHRKDAEAYAKQYEDEENGIVLKS